jgi:N-methylhydantoinase A
VLLPRNPGILSAIGMIMADVIKDYSLTIMRNQENVTSAFLSEQFMEIEKRGREDLESENIPDDGIVLEKYLDMRYEGQSYEIIVPFDDDYIERFHALHEKTYGYRNEDKIIEVVNIRLRARGMPEKPRFQKSEKIDKMTPSDAFLGQNDVVFDGSRIPTKIVARDKLRSGNRIEGPAIMVEYSSTLVIPPFASAFVDEYGNIVMEIMTE